MALRIHLAGRWTEGETLVLPPAESRHVQVLRLQPGDTLALFNGEDELEWPAEVVRMGRNAVELRIAAPARAVERELPVAVTLAIGIPANERMDALVEKATELGAAALRPLICERSVVRLAGERRMLLEHLQVALDDRQQVVEVVGDPAGQLAHALEPLGVAQVLLRLRPLQAAGEKIAERFEESHLVFAEDTVLARADREPCVSRAK